MRYKYIGIFLMLFLIVRMEINAQNFVSVSLENMQYNQGEIVNIPVHFSTPGLSVGTFSIEIDFDKTMIEPVSCEGEAPWFVACNVGNTNVKLAGLNTNGQSTDFIGANLQFEIIGVPGQLTYLELTLNGLTDENGVDILYENTHGQIAIYCNDHMNVNRPIYHTIEKGIFRANQSLNSNITIDETVKPVEFRSGETIYLNPQFEVTLGSNFQALIQDCNDLTIPNFRNVEDKDKRQQSKR